VLMNPSLVVRAPLTHVEKIEDDLRVRY